MTTGWPALCLLLLLPMCRPASPQRNFSRSLRLTQKTRDHVRVLLPRYKEEQLGDRTYEDLSLRTVPSFHMGHSQWKSIPDWERLSTASKYLRMFRDQLLIRRQQMVQFWKDHPRREKAMRLIEAMFGIQRDLNDLIGQVNLQLRSLNSSSLPQASSSPAPQVLTPPTKQDFWTNQKQGYAILRDLERYLGKLARDFIFLRARHSDRPAAPTDAHHMSTWRKGQKHTT